VSSPRIGLLCGYEGAAAKKPSVNKRAMLFML
jgi:hypothetical protein